MANAYSFFDRISQVETPMSMASLRNQSAQPLASYLEPAAMNVNFPAATPPGSSFGRSPYQRAGQPPPVAPNASTSANRAPTSNPRETYVTHNDFSSPRLSPSQTRELEPPHGDDRRFLVRNVDTDTEGLEVVQLFQVSQFYSVESSQVLSSVSESRVSQRSILDYVKHERTILCLIL